MTARRNDHASQLHGPDDHAATRIYAFSPSGAVPDAQRVTVAQDNLRALGFEIRLDRSATSRHQRFAGTDAQRSSAFERAAASDCPIVMAVRGGYGMTRLLDRLDYRALARSHKMWIGLSDFTAFHLAMLARARAVTWAGPSLLSGFSGAPLEELDPTTRDCFIDAALGRLQAVGFRCHGAAPFEAEGTLWGGNLSIVCALIGTPYFPKINGGILFLEDVNEHPFRIERMLTQLLLAGVLQRQSAIVLGAFSGYSPQPNDHGFGLPVVRRWLAARTHVPIVSGLPFGHVDPVLTLPHGATVQIAVEGRTCYLLLSTHHADH